MRILLFVLTLASSALAFAVPSVSSSVAGTVQRKGPSIFLQSSDSCGLYLLKTTSPDAQAALNKLAPGDTLTGTGTFDTKACVANIDSVDYVGLKKMLGDWISSEGSLSVHDFNSLSFYPGTQSDLDYANSPSIEYKYSVTPSNGKEWVLFLSDCKSTTFATIQFSNNLAIMKIFDSDSGNVTKTFFLSRRDTPN